MGAVAWLVLLPAVATIAAIVSPDEADSPPLIQLLAWPAVLALLAMPVLYGIGWRRAPAVGSCWALYLVFLTLLERIISPASMHLGSAIIGVAAFSALGVWDGVSATRVARSRDGILADRTTTRPRSDRPRLAARQQEERFVFTPAGERWLGVALAVGLFGFALFCVLGAVGSIGRDGGAVIGLLLAALSSGVSGFVGLRIARWDAAFISDDGVLIVNGRNRRLYPVGSVMVFAVEGTPSSAARAKVVLRLADDDEAKHCGTGRHTDTARWAEEMNEALDRHR